MFRCIQKDRVFFFLYLNFSFFLSLKFDLTLFCDFCVSILGDAAVKGAYFFELSLLAEDFESKAVCWIFVKVQDDIVFSYRNLGFPLSQNGWVQPLQQPEGCVLGCWLIMIIFNDHLDVPLKFICFFSILFFQLCKLNEMCKGENWCRVIVERMM